MGTTVEKLPRSLQNNQYAIKLAQQVDRQRAQVSKLKETEGRPGRGSRAVAGGVGAIITGGIAGMTENRTAQTAIGVVTGGATALAGAFIDNDAVFDAGMGGVFGGLFSGAAQGSSMLKSKVLNRSADAADDDLEDDEE